MPTIPIFFQAQQISTMAVTPMTAAADGTLSAGTPVDLHSTGVFESLTVEGDRGLFEVSPADSGMENYQDGKTSFTATLSALDKNGKVSVNLDNYIGVDILRIVATGTQYGTGGAAQKTLTLYGRIDRASTPWQAGANATSLTLRPCGIALAWA